jgi:hypothetical protein
MEQDPLIALASPPPITARFASSFFMLATRTSSCWEACSLLCDRLGANDPEPPSPIHPIIRRTRNRSPRIMFVNSVNRWQWGEGMSRFYAKAEDEERCLQSSKNQRPVMVWV